MHANPHVGAAHVGVECAGPAGQMVPHPPQFCGSFVSLTHAASLLQYVRPALHDTPHMPATHCGVPFVATGHGAAQPLQLFGSVCSSTQPPLQLVYPVLQAVPHTLLTQVVWDSVPPAAHV
jgi:hypothetical protein